MRSATVCVMLTILFACSARIAAGDAWQAPPADAAQRVTWLVNYLTSLADEGGVGSRNDLPRSLHAAFTSTHVDQRTYPVMSCSGSVDRSEVDGTWFKDLTGGVAHMSYPRFFINGPGTTGSPVLTYDKTTSTCDTLRFRDRVSLGFDNMPGFACVTGDKLIAANPLMKQGVATDGVLVFSYQGKLDQGTSTILEFTGRYGGPCLISATVTRNLGSGYRMFRARKKQAACWDQVAAAFCRVNPPPALAEPTTMHLHHRDRSAAWTDWIGRLDGQEQKSCPGLGAYFDMEPAVGPKVEPPPYRPRPMCGAT